MSYTRTTGWGRQSDAVEPQECDWGFMDDPVLRRAAERGLRSWAWRYKLLDDLGDLRNDTLLWLASRPYDTTDPKRVWWSVGRCIKKIAMRDRNSFTEEELRDWEM